MADVSLFLVEDDPKHICSVCNGEYTEAEGGIEGFFGIMPIRFCPYCYGSLVDMVHYHDINDEIGSTHTSH